MESFDTIIKEMKAATENHETPQWVKALSNCLIVLINQLQEPLLRVGELETKLNQLENGVNSMLDVNMNLQEENKVFHKKLDHFEQRNYNLVVHGLPELTNKNTDDLVMNVISNVNLNKIFRY